MDGEEALAGPKSNEDKMLTQHKDGCFLLGLRRGGHAEPRGWCGGADSEVSVKQEGRVQWSGRNVETGKRSGLVMSAFFTPGEGM